IATAPMMDWTDRHCRYFLRRITRRALLYTEMVTTGAVLHGDRERLLGFDPSEHPVALQLGGSEPGDLARSARIAEEWGYGEVNLNVGCPSDRVQSGRFGACLMAEPDLVARLVAAMRDAVAIPVTVKSRIAIDDMEEWPTLERFVRAVSAAGCTRFVVHARKAWLKGLSPKENRELPPLRYDLVHRLKAEFPHLHVTINGGIRSLDAAGEQLAHVDAVMIGRAAYEDPYVLAEVDRRFHGDPAPASTRHEVVAAMLPYVEARLAAGTPLNAITRHMLGLFQGMPGARAWRRHLSENAHRPGAGPEVLARAAALVPGPGAYEDAVAPLRKAG
ncbi:tRNA dihydrouridine(20/20a) synthase DusA, partial [Arenibaculum sp.]|uniref:tRNA dihydrouridine(20/20a) synthase DusA n=1 Tax=Arenibaculum sp. TaxID=2865862 RepID=UPI002E0F1C8F|nr:tRNA dihydrouridine(20/20a) synthase DusA [Arenibaculum sp.]